MRTVLQTGLEVEMMADHVGCEFDDRGGSGSGNGVGELALLENGIDGDR